MLFSRSDLKYTFRLLAKSPGFAALSTMVLAGGLGISLFTLSFIYTMGFKDVNLPNGDRIVVICGEGELGSCFPLKAFEFSAIRDEISTLENVGVYNTRGLVYVRANDSFNQALVMRTEWNMFQLAGTSPILGRTLLESDQGPQSEPVAVISHDFWEQAFDSDPTLIDSYIDLDEVPTRVVGVMPDGFSFPAWTDIWVPIGPEILNPANNDMVLVTPYALRKEGVSTSAANEEISSLLYRMRQQYPFTDTGNYTADQRLINQADTGFISSLPQKNMHTLANKLAFSILGLLSLILFLLACINVGTLLLARTNERLKDVSIRVALGAPRKRLMIQTMGESIVISIVGTLLAILFAGVCLEALNVFLATSVGDEGIEFWMQFRVDRFMLLLALFFAILTILITSALPSWKLINGNFNSVMRDGTRGALGLKTGRFSRSLVVVAVALISILLYAFITLGTVMWSLGSTYQFVEPEGIYSAEIRTNNQFANPSERLQYFQTLESRLRSHPDTRAVLLTGMAGTQRLEVDNVTYLNEQDKPVAPVQIISGNVRFVGANLLEGRLLDDRDNPDSLPAAMVSRSLATKLWPSRSAIGNSLRIATTDGAGQYRTFTVVGMVSDSPIDGDDMYKQEYDMVYLPLGQMDSTHVTAIIQSNGSAREATGLLADTVIGLNSGVDFAIRNWLQDRQSVSFMVLMAIATFSAVGLFAFLVSIAGVFGLTRNSIQLRTQEIGTRRALGATDGLIGRKFITQGARQTLLGILIACLICAPVTILIIMMAGAGRILPGLLATSIAMLFFLVTVLWAIYSPIKSLLKKEPGELLRHQ